MSDDKLAEALMKSWHSSTCEGPTLVCECGWEVDMLDMETEPQAQGCEDAFQTHLFEALAAAARAFIGDEVNAKYEAEKPTLNRWDPRDDGYEYGLDIAEQIARGDTK